MTIGNITSLTVLTNWANLHISNCIIKSNLAIPITNSIIENNVIQGSLSLHGLGHYYHVDQNIIRYNTFLNGGISLANSASKNLILNNTITNVPVGILENGTGGSGLTYDPGSNTIANNTVINCGIGIESANTQYQSVTNPLGARNTSITQNTLISNSIGILLQNVNYLQVNQNTFNSNQIGIKLDSVTNLTILKNIMNSIQQVQNLNDNNVTWDNGYPAGGNYWSDYLTRYPNAKQIGSSGIGDTPYIIDGNNTDHYPFIT